MHKSDREFVGALGKGLAVIETFSASSTRQTLSAVALATGLTRATARRYLRTLAQLGYAETDGKHFWLTPRVLRLGYAYFSSASLPQTAQPVLDRIGERTGEVASLATIDGTDVIFLARSDSRRIVVASTNVGQRLPAYCTAIGRTLLATLSQAELERRLKESLRKKLTPKTKVGFRDLVQEIQKVKQDGYSVIDEELEIGLRSIALPVADSRGLIRIGVSVSVPAGRMTVRQIVRDILPALKMARASLEQLL